MEKRKFKGVLGLDISLTCTGLSKIDFEEERTETGSIKTKPTEGTRVQRYVRILREVLRFLDEGDLVLIEDYAYAIKADRSSLATMGELNGIVKLAVYKRTGREAVTIPSTQWKKYLCNNGKLNKDAFKLEVYKGYGKDFKTNDEAVAFTLANLGASLLADVVAAPKYQRDVIDKIRNSESFLQALAMGK